MTTGEALREIRVSKGLTRKWVAARSGVSETHLVNLEEERVGVKDNTLERLCNTMGVSRSLFYFYILSHEPAPIGKEALYSEVRRGIVQLLDLKQD